MTTVLLITLAVIVGTALGRLHFAALQMQVRALIENQGAVLCLVPMARFIVTAGGLYLAVRLGAVPLLGVTFGFVIARTARVRWKRGAA